MIAAYQRGLMDTIENNRNAFNAQYVQGTPMRFMADKYLPPGSPLFDMFKEMKFYTDETWKEMDKLGVAPGYVEWYYPGQWKETQAARGFFGKGKLGSGNKNFRGQGRTSPIFWKASPRASRLPRITLSR